MSAPYPDCGNYEKCDSPALCQTCQIDRRSGEAPDVEPEK